MEQLEIFTDEKGIPLFRLPFWKTISCVEATTPHIICVDDFALDICKHHPNGATRSGRSASG